MIVWERSHRVQVGWISEEGLPFVALTYHSTTERGPVISIVEEMKERDKVEVDEACGGNTRESDTSALLSLSPDQQPRIGLLLISMTMEGKRTGKLLSSPNPLYSLYSTAIG